MMTAAGVEAAGSPSTGGVTSEALRLKHCVQRQRPGMADVAGARDLPDQPCVRTGLKTAANFRVDGQACIIPPQAIILVYNY